MRDGEDCPTWTHPDPDVDPSLYALLSHDKMDHSEPRYEALSYTWGSHHDPQTIVVSDGSGILRTLLINQNLASALQHLRSPDKVRRVWIDAICINQKDDIEKSQQVSRMHLVYARAYRVVVWLGLEHGDSNIGLSTLDHLGSQLNVTKSGRHFMAIDAQLDPT